MIDIEVVFTLSCGCSAFKRADCFLLKFLGREQSFFIVYSISFSFLYFMFLSILLLSVSYCDNRSDKSVSLVKMPGTRTEKKFEFLVASLLIRNLNSVR